jgi:hypothetical protein
MELISDKKIEDTNSQRSHMVGLGWYEIFEEYPKNKDQAGKSKSQYQASTGIYLWNGKKGSIRFMSKSMFCNFH